MLDREHRSGIGSPSRSCRSRSAPGSKRRSPRARRPAQELAWPPIAAGEHVLLISPTGTGKTLAAFLAILDRLFRARQAGTLGPGLRCVYVSPLRSLNYDIERNLAAPLEGIGRRLELDASPIRVGVRTGDTSAYERRKLRDDPPHVLITTPESLSLLLSQEAWRPHWQAVEHLIVDEVHALAPTKRGADLAVSLERLAAQAGRDPCRVGLSATCRAGRGDRAVPGRAVADLSRHRGPPAPRHAAVGVRRREPDPARRGAPPRPELPPAAAPPAPDHRRPTGPRSSSPTRGPSPRRSRTTCGSLGLARSQWSVVSGQCSARAEGGTAGSTAGHGESPARRNDDDLVIAAHHSALDAQRRRAIEAGLKSGEVRAVVTSTSLELGVDIGTADLTVQVGLPGGVVAVRAASGPVGPSPGCGVARAPAGGDARRAGRARRSRRGPRGPVGSSRSGSSSAPLDVVCQQLVGMACAGEQSVDGSFELIRKAGPMAGLSRADFDACLAFLAGDLAAPAGRLRARAGRRAAMDVAADLEARRLVRRPQRPGRPMVPQQRRHDRSEESVRVLEDGRGRRHAGGVVRRAAGPRRPVRARRPLAGSPPAGGFDRPCPAGRRRAEPAALDQRPPVALVRAGRSSCRPSAPRRPAGWARRAPAALALAGR